MLKMTPQFYGNEILDWRVTLKFILSTLNFEDEKIKPHVKNNNSAETSYGSLGFSTEVTKLDETVCHR